MFKFLLRLIKIFVGAVILVVGCLALFVNLHDFMFLILNLAVIGLGCIFFFEPTFHYGNKR